MRRVVVMSVGMMIFAVMFVVVRFGIRIAMPVVIVISIVFVTFGISILFVTFALRLLAAIFRVLRMLRWLLRRARSGGSECCVREYAGREGQ